MNISLEERKNFQKAISSLKNSSQYNSWGHYLHNFIINDSFYAWESLGYEEGILLQHKFSLKRGNIGSVCFREAFYTLEKNKNTPEFYIFFPEFIWEEVDKSQYLQNLFEKTTTESCYHFIFNLREDPRKYGIKINTQYPVSYIIGGLQLLRICFDKNCKNLMNWCEKNNLKEEDASILNSCFYIPSYTDYYVREGNQNHSCIDYNHDLNFIRKNLFNKFFFLEKGLDKNIEKNFYLWGIMYEKEYNKHILDGVSIRNLYRKNEKDFLNNYLKFISTKQEE